MIRLLRIPAFAMVALLANCATPPSTTAACTACDSELVYFGTHGSTPGQEIFGARFDEATGKLTPLGPLADVFRPTWLAADPSNDVLFSVSEAGNDGKTNGSVVSFKVDRASGAITRISQTDAGGGGTTHLDFDPVSRTLFAANFGSGTATAMPVDGEGRIGEVAGKGTDYGTGPNRRQAGPHAHGVTLSPDGRHLLVPDLGADRTFVFTFDPATRALAPAKIPFAQVPPGTGPRHIEFGKDGRFAYLATELTAEVIVYRWNPADGSLDPVQTVDLMPANFEGQRSAAEIAVSGDGRFLYVSSREGENAVHVLAIDQATGQLTHLQRFETGERPWSFAFSPSERWMLVAEEGASHVAVLARDPVTGQLSATGEGTDVFEPVNITFMP